MTSPRPFADYRVTTSDRYALTESTLRKDCHLRLGQSLIYVNLMIAAVFASVSKPPLTAFPGAAQVAPLDAQPGARSAWKPRFRLAMIASGSARQITAARATSTTGGRFRYGRRPQPLLWTRLANGVVNGFSPSRTATAVIAPSRDSGHHDAACLRTYAEEGFDAQAKRSPPVRLE
jgi:hypothetical protein